MKFYCEVKQLGNSNAHRHIRHSQHDKLTASVDDDDNDTQHDDEHVQTIAANKTVINHPNKINGEVE
jgi:hypothetical protein